MGAIQQGHGVPQDEAEAIKWFRRAAELGEEMAPVKLLELGVDS
ncbi:MAG: SEL1-like repeat protein [Thiobacillus sp.]